MTKQTKQLLEQITENQLKKIEFDEQLEQKIKEVACQATGATIEQFESKDRHKEPAFSRFLVMWYFNRYQSYTVTKAGRLTNRGHCDCIHANKVIDNIFYDKPERKQWLQNFKDLLND